MKKLSIITLLLSLAAVVYASTVEELNNEGLAGVQTGRFGEAVASFEFALRQMPGNATIQRNLAVALNAWGVDLGNRGRFETAVRKLEKARRTLDGDAMIERNLTVVRVNWGTNLMEKGLHRQAEGQFFKAYATAASSVVPDLDRRRSRNFFLKAREARQADQARSAKADLNRALEINPRNVHALVELADLHYDQGEYLEALDSWIEAEHVDPDVPGLSDRIEKVAREAVAEAGFDQRSKGYFTVSYEGDEREEAARQVLRILNEARRDVGRGLKYHPREKIEVVLYTREQFSEATVVPDWTGGLYDGKIRVPLTGESLGGDQLDQLRQTLYHEYVHAVVHDVTKSQVASWFNEGLAMYFEKGEKEREQRYEADTLQIAAWASAGELPLLSAMPTKFTSIEDKTEAQKAYRIARTFVTWLADRYRPHRFKSVLQGIADGWSLEEAIEDVYNRTLEKLESKWRDEVL